ncbi:DUF6861 domain-containing protein [Nevskia sp.]|uniref:DUF6861 domain-containing protein n=1 Tax=Nevskia sp. TaxID=1929292 RepID=UPI0026015BE1|nr:polymorphic toxin type 15 domain-containing protein [Nevskia sp.]
MSRFLFLETLRRWEARLNPVPARAPVSVKRSGLGGVFRSALPQGVKETLTRVDHVEEALKRADGMALQRMAQTLAGIELASIWPILIETLKDIALFYGGSVVTGAAVGGAVGSLGAGVGAIPGAAAGAAAGVTLGTWLLAIFGLKSLIEEVKDSIVAAFTAYKDGFSLAWKADPHPEPMNHGLAGASHHVQPAASRFADGHVIVLTAILIGIVAWLTRGKGSRSEVLKEIENSSRLGPKVAAWVKENEAALKAHPGLKPKPAATGKATPERPAAADKAPEKPKRAAEPAKPKRMLLKKVPCFKTQKLPPGKWSEMDRQLADQEIGLNDMTVQEYLDGRKAFEDPSIRSRDRQIAKAARAKYETKLIRELKDMFIELGSSEREAKALALSESAKQMNTLAALHNPDLVAAGIDIIGGMGDREVNETIGRQWKSGRGKELTRIGELDAAAEAVPEHERSSTKMNGQMERCK